MNALTEFLGHTKNKNILCAKIITEDYKPSNKPIILTTGYTKEDLNQFLSLLNFNYDNGHGTQYIYGTIWYSDGTWSTRSEYDGSEWWDYYRCPEIPDDVRSIPKERNIKLNSILL